MTSSELAREVFSILETTFFDRPSRTKFEMAYQSRVAIDKIKFAIKQLEPSTMVQEAAFNWRTHWIV